MLHQNALKAYEQVEQDFLVQGASRHRLVEILFAELLSSLDRAMLALSVNDLAARSAGTTKALTIIYALNSSLDHERGGAVAKNLADLYEWSRLTIIASGREKSRERLQSVRFAMSEIADAWSSIADRAA